ncbi:hypothetical protein AbraIFM66950_003396 [Aspergillus brasiliensis]|nr:hypothetical protein AbraIFM66950_003396 [Aspergillus brasiliensis]
MEQRFETQVNYCNRTRKEQGNQSIYLVFGSQMMEGARDENKEHIPYLKRLSEAEAPYPKPLTTEGGHPSGISTV